MLCYSPSIVSFYLSTTFHNNNYITFKCIKHQILTLYCLYIMVLLFHRNLKKKIRVPLGCEGLSAFATVLFLLPTLQSY